jgi:Carboxypeptidase regulatory-like domain/TonB dependent receptor
MNPKVVKFVLGLCVLSLMFSAPAGAQVVGATVSGSITDPRGDAIPSAKVSAKNLGTGVTTTTTTNATGAFSIANLNPAEYEISASAAGFSTAQTKVTLAVGAKQEVNLALKVGQVTQIVEVTGAAPTVETTNSTLSEQVDSTTVRELPLNGRDWASLAQLQPGVAQVRTQEVITQVGAVGRGLGTQESIDGNRPTQNSYRLNGIFVNDYSNAGPGNVLGANLGVDAIQEFSVITSNYSAEYGYTSGGVINAVTKQGTNQFHGTAFEFIRNDVLDAANFFENFNVQKKAPFRRNQFGGSAGGPIKKDKFWIFGAYEGLRQTKGIPHTALVPSDAARGTNTGGIGTVHDPTSGALLPPVTVNQSYLTFFPHCAAGAPTFSFGDTCRFAFSGKQVVPDNFGNGRGDLKLSDKDTMTGSFYYDHSTFTQPDQFNQKLEGFFVGRKGASIEETHLFGASFVNTVRVGWNYTQGFGQLTPSALNPDVAKSSPFAIEPGLHAARIAGIGGGPGVPQFDQPFSGGLNGDAIEDFTHQTVQTFDDAGVTIGKHSLKFGFMFIRLEEKLFAPFTSNGTAQFNSLADFLTDTPVKVQSPPVGGIATVKTHYTFTSIPAVYFQDDWKVRPNLTLNMGLRYEMETIPTDKLGLIRNLPFLFTNPTTPGCSTCTNTYFARNPTNKNFEPRVGFAWDPFKDGKTSVRGGFGIFDALPLPYELALNNAQTSPFHVNVTAPGCAGNVQPCVSPGEFPNLSASTAGPCPAPLNPAPPCVFQEFSNPAFSPINGQSWNYVEPKLHRNYTYQWNLNLQRQLPGDFSLTVAYAGSRGKHNPFQTDDLNTVFPTKTAGRWLFPVVPSLPDSTGVVPTGSPVSCHPTAITPPGACGNTPTPTGGPTAIVSGQLINPNVAEIQSTIWQSKSWYDALQVELLKRMSHGVQLQASFTWSKTEDTSSGSFAGDNFAGDVNPTIPWWDLKVIKGLSDFNVSRNLVINALWDIPVPASFHGPAAFIAKGWQLGGIVSLSDGVPVWAFNIPGSDPMGQLDSEPVTIPDRVPGCSLTNPSSGRHGSLQYINPACFSNAMLPAGISAAQCQPFGLRPAGTNGPGDPGSSTGIPGTCANLLGNLGRNTVTGPGLVNIDYSMIKDTKIPKISETFTVQFRAEFFNVFNHANFAPPNAGNLSPFDGNGAPIGGFGTLTTTQTPERQIQFALKLIW